MHKYDPVVTEMDKALRIEEWSEIKSSEEKNPQFTSSIRIKSKWIKELNVNYETFEGWKKTLVSKLGIGKTSLTDLTSRSNYEKIDDLIILKILHGRKKS